MTTTAANPVPAPNGPRDYPAPSAYRDVDLGAIREVVAVAATCRDCHHDFTGWAVVALGAHVGAPTLCLLCAKHRAAKEEIERNERQRHLEAASRDARRAKARQLLNVPPLYFGVTLGTWQTFGAPAEQERKRRILAVARAWLERWPVTDTLLLYRGEPGTGKGHIAWALAKAIVEEHDATAQVLTCAELVRDLRGAWGGREGPTEDQRLARYRRLGLLVIDDVSRHAFYGQQIQQHLFDVINDRLNWGRPTILTSNEGDDQLHAILGAALVNRLEGHGGILNFGTASWRTRETDR